MLCLNWKNGKEKKRNQNRPVNLARILKQAQGDAVHGCVAPALVEEAAGAIEMVKVVLVDARPPEGHVGNLKVAPEMAGRVAVGLGVGVGPALRVGQPAERVVRVHVVLVRRHELERLGPEPREALGAVVQRDGEAVRLVVVLHPAEDVVVDVAEEVHLRLDAPVPPHVRERRVPVEVAAVPPAHLVVRHLVAVLHIVLLEDLGRFVEEVIVDPARHRPILLGDLLCYRPARSARLAIWSTGIYAGGGRRTVSTGRLRLGLGPTLELVGEILVVEKGPRVVEL